VKDEDLGVEKGGKGNVAPGVRPAGHVDNPQPMPMRHPNE
jgi:hypothetical protein